MGWETERAEAQYDELRAEGYTDAQIIDGKPERDQEAREAETKRQTAEVMARPHATSGDCAADDAEDEPEPHDLTFLYAYGGGHPVRVDCSCGDTFKLVGP